MLLSRNVMLCIVLSLSPTCVFLSCTYLSFFLPVSVSVCPAFVSLSEMLVEKLDALFTYWISSSLACLSLSRPYLSFFLPVSPSMLVTCSWRSQKCSLENVTIYLCVAYHDVGQSVFLRATKRNQIALLQPPASTTSSASAPHFFPPFLTVKAGHPKTLLTTPRRHHVPATPSLFFILPSAAPLPLPPFTVPYLTLPTLTSLPILPSLP